MNTRVEYLKKLPSFTQLAETLDSAPEKFLLIYDRRLEKIPDSKRWLRQFEFTYPVKGGESLKDLAAFPEHAKKILRLISPVSARGVCVVALGGGSIGDFAGFLASVMKRGVPLIHIPTTFLSAMDSAHGGKTALNVSEFKNQIGTFYPAHAVFLIQALLEELPDRELRSAAGELAKMALIEGGELFEALRGVTALDIEFLWQHLPRAIESKCKWVAKDPLETSGERQILNLGHSLGHVLERHFELSHGVAVAEGLIFALGWSHHQGFIETSAFEAGLEVLENKLGFLSPERFADRHGRISQKKLLRLVGTDKKLADSRHLNFIFLEDVGAPFRKRVTLESFLTETRRQGWTA